MFGSIKDSELNKLGVTTIGDRIRLTKKVERTLNEDQKSDNGNDENTVVTKTSTCSLTLLVFGAPEG